MTSSEHSRANVARHLADDRKCRSGGPPSTLIAAPSRPVAPVLAATLLTTLALVLFAPLYAVAQTQTSRIGYLTSGGCPGIHATRGEAGRLFLEGLRERGYVLGQNLVIECRQADPATDERFRQLAGELVGLRVPLIFAVSSAAVRGVRNVSMTIPVVALDLESDPVRSGLAVSLSRPGGNITGIFLDAEQMNGKRVQMLRELLPRLSQITALWDASLDPAQLKATEALTRSLGVRFRVVSVSGPGEFAQALDTARRQRSDAVVVIEGPFINVNAKQLADHAIQNRLPTIGIFPSFAGAGGLMSYGPNVDHLFKQVTSHIDRVLKGTPPADLPIERPTRFYTAVNLRTAKALGLRIPPSLILQADQIIE